MSLNDKIIQSAKKSICPEEDSPARHTESDASVILRSASIRNAAYQNVAELCIFCSRHTIRRNPDFIVKLREISRKSFQNSCS